MIPSSKFNTWMDQTGVDGTSVLPCNDVHCETQNSVHSLNPGLSVPKEQPIALRRQ